MFKNIKHLTLGVLAAGTIASCNSTKNVQENDTTLETKADSISYSIGKNIGNDLGSQEYEWNADIIAKGLKDAFNGEDTLISDQEAQQLMMELQQELQSMAKEKSAAAGQENVKKGQEFLAKNKKREDVKVTDSGLQYEIIEEGSGKSPGANDRVTVHYKGTLLDGTIFDSSYDRGEPITFGLGNVIPGWQEGLQLMQEGAKYKLYIPSDLAYGERGAGQQIGPNETLIFEVELINVEEQE